MIDLKKTISKITAYELLSHLVEAMANPVCPIIFKRVYSFDGEVKLDLTTNLMYKIAGVEQIPRSKEERYSFLGLDRDEFRDLYDCLFPFSIGDFVGYNEEAGKHDLPKLLLYDNGNNGHIGNFERSPTPEMIERYREFAEFQRTSCRCAPRVSN